MTWSSGVERWNQPVTELESVDGKDISADEFRNEFVNKCKPVVIRSATDHWPAATRWNEPGYFDRVLGDQEFAVHQKPKMEMNWRKRHWPDRFARLFDAQSASILSYADMMRLTASTETAFAYALGISESTSLSPLEADMGGFEFLPEPAPTNYYEPRRAFLHGISYTDWHYHPDDETLMCQFGRTKVVHMLPPDQRTWQVIYEIAKQESHIGSADPARYPGLRTLNPAVAVVNPGDATYIPPNWWHAVTCSKQSDRLGVTVAYCWGSPLHIRMDPRFPFHRFHQRHGPLKHRLQLAAASVAWRAFSAAGKTLPEIPGTTGTPG